jgi:hypothetical protein
LCAAFLPDLSLLTMYCGLSLEAATLWPLIQVAEVCFLTTLRCVPAMTGVPLDRIALLQSLAIVISISRSRELRIRPGGSAGQLIQLHCGNVVLVVFLRIEPEHHLDARYEA